MDTATKTVLCFFLAVITRGVCSNVVTVAHNTTINFTCTTSGHRTPGWFVNETEVSTWGDRYRVSTSNGVAQTATLVINGNRTCETVNVYCEVYNTTEQRFNHMHNTTLRFQGCLPSPENVHIKEHFNSSTIEWTPPYSAMNNDIIYVDPHITQYTVCITDNYTGNIIVKENVTETRYTNIRQDDSLCPMYQVSAWNAGGEGEMSDPVQDSTPQVPRNVIVGSITVRGTVTTNVVHIHISNVDVVCTSRIPEFFLITLMTPTGSVLNETRQHRPGQPVPNFTISLPQTVDVCTLHLRISAGNSARMSAPSEAVEVVCSGDSTDSMTTTTSTMAVTTITSSGSGSEGNNQQGNSTTLIVVIGIIATIVGAVIVAAIVGIVYCRGHRKHKVKKNSEIEMKPNQAYETVSLPSPSQSAAHVHTKPCPAYEVVVQACH